MKVIMKDTGEVKEVADGYARNYLFPKQLAEPATAASIAAAAAKREQMKKQEASNEEQWNTVKDALNGKEFTLAAPANEDGTLFGAVQESAIIDLLKEGGFDIRAGWLEIAEPIKKTGPVELKVAFPNKATAAITLVVKPQE